MTARRLRLDVGGGKDDVVAILADLAVVVVFAIVGRATHSEGLDPAGVFRTALPFAAAALVGHVAVKFTRGEARSLISGTAIWLIGWLGGMAGRILLTEGTAPAFVAVAGASLAAGILGWRLAIAGARRLRRTPPPAA